MMLFAVFAAVIGVLSASVVSNRPDGTLACADTRPVVISTAGQTFSQLGYDGTTAYAPDMLCEYQFQAPAGDNVLLSFTDFVTEECTDCTCDYLEIYDGLDDTGTLIGKYCGGVTIPSVAAGSSAFMRFVSDSSTGGTGFLGTYDAGNAACEGGVVLTAMNGSFTSNNFPQNYGLNEDCTWTFRPPSATHRVEVWFDSFVIEDSCTYDTVDMLDSAGNRMNKWWGDGPSNADLHFASYPGEGDVSIHFTSDVSITANGFRGYWQMVDTSL